MVAPSYKSTALLINDALVSRVEILSKKSNSIDLKVTSSVNQEANVKISFDDNIARIKVTSANDKTNKISLVFGGFLIAHGLGDEEVQKALCKALHNAFKRIKNM